jgi:hypothetical protein
MEPDELDGKTVIIVFIGLIVHGFTVFDLGKVSLRVLELLLEVVRHSL